MTKMGRNERCPCGSGLKYKKCCAAKERGARSRLMLLVVAGAVVAAVLAAVASFTGEGAAGGTTRAWSAEHGHYHDASGVAVP